VLVAGRPAVGFARIDEVDGQAHLEQLSVLPSHMRRGNGTALVEAVCAWAAVHGYREVTLCTFAEVPFNAPFFAKRGFVPVESLTPGLVELRDWERDLGLDALGPRIVMRRTLG
jgi:GNAT superfamily N-acetyltransferase